PPERRHTGREAAAAGQPAQLFSFEGWLGPSTPRISDSRVRTISDPEDTMNAPTDTIAAIASAPGMAGVGVVRVSGPAVPAIATALLGRMPMPRHAHFTAFRNGAGALIDRGLLLHFPAAASYTGEHVLELQGHGSAVLLDLLLRRCCEL